MNMSSPSTQLSKIFGEQLKEDSDFEQVFDGVPDLQKGCNQVQLIQKMQTQLQEFSQLMQSSSSDRPFAGSEILDVPVALPLLFVNFPKHKCFPILPRLSGEFYLWPVRTHPCVVHSSVFIDFLTKMINLLHLADPRELFNFRLRGFLLNQFNRIAVQRTLNVRLEILERQGITFILQIVV